jgi:cold shock protein
MARLHGTIKRLIREKGLGFIAVASTQEYVFRHAACTGTPFPELREGQPVSFDIGQNRHGPLAENVTTEEVPPPCAGF